MRPEAQILIYVLLLIGIVVAGLLIKRFGLDFIQARTQGEKRLEICEIKGLGNRQFLVVVRYDSQKILLGVSPGKIEHLCQLDDEPPGPQKKFERLLNEEGES